MRHSHPDDSRHTLEELVEYLWRNRIDPEGTLEQVAARMLAEDPGRRQRIIDEHDSEIAARRGGGAAVAVAL